MFYKARSVPLRHKNKVRDESRRLEEAGIITKVISSEYASPTVNVLKSNGIIRICGDYSKTIDKSMNIAQYPLRCIEEIMGKIHKLNTFQKFISKLLSFNCRSMKVLRQRHFTFLIIYHSGRHAVQLYFSHSYQSCQPILILLLYTKTIF